MVAMRDGLHGEAFPEHGPATTQYDFLASLASRAVGHAYDHTWWTEITEDGIAWVRTRAHSEPCSATDAALLSIGTALTAVRLAMRRFGNVATMRYAPDTTRPGAIAQIAFAKKHTPSLDDHLRFNALLAMTDRCRINETRTVPRGMLRALPHFVTRPGVWVSSITAASDRMRARDCLRRFDDIHIIHDELIGPPDMAAPGLFLLGRQERTEVNGVALGEALQELVVLLRLQEVQVRVLCVGNAMGAQFRDTLALTAPPQLLVSAAYGAPRG